MEDEFRMIAGFPGYRVNRKGVVESCWARRGKLVDSTDSWRPLIPIRRQGYLTVNLPTGGKKSARRIHRLVLEAFVGPCPPGMVACHGDGDRSNNDFTNLRWDTQQGNADDTLRHGMRPLGSRCRSSKLTEDEVVEIRRKKAEGEPMTALAARFGVTPENIKAIVYRRSWRHLPEGHDAGVVGLAELEIPGCLPGAAA